MNPILKQRLLGAALLVGLLSFVGWLLPAPTRVQPLEAGMQRVDVAVDDPRPIAIPKNNVPGSQSDPEPVSPPVAPPGHRDLPVAGSAIVTQAPVANPSDVNSRAAAAPIEDDDDLAAPAGPDVAPDEPAAQADPVARPAVANPVPKPSPATVIPKAAAAAKPPAAVPPPQSPGKASARPLPALPSPPIAAATGAWSVQAGSYADIGNARQVEAELHALGYAGSITLIESGGSARYRVRSGPFPSRDAADAAKLRLEQNRIPASVVPNGG